MRTFLNTGEIHKNRVKHPTLLRPYTDSKDSIANGEFRKFNELKLNKCKKVIISNKHLRDLYDDEITKTKLTSILLKLTREEFLSISIIPSLSNNGNRRAAMEKDLESIKDGEKVYVPLNNESWKCYIFISWEEISQLRDWMIGYDQFIPSSSSSSWKKCERLLTRRVQFDQQVHLGDEDQEEHAQEEKNLVFRYDRTLMAPVTLNVHVYSKV